MNTAMNTARARFAPVLLGAVLVVIAMPLLWAVLASLSPEHELFERARLFPAALVLDHYRALFHGGTLPHAIINSLVVAACTTVLCLTLGSLCAYALARLHFPGRRALLSFVLAVSMFPQISIVPPLFLVLRKLHLIDTYPGLIFPYLTFAMPLTIWLLLGFFRQLPPELEEAALVDGASRTRVLFEIVAPLAAPALATTAVLTFIYCWNEFLFALSFTLGPERQTVPVAIAMLRGQYQVPWGQVLAAVVLSTAPVAVLVLIFQRRIVQGLVSGAVKG
jgi:ABC-type glycerol-3-phosphate transport system permease component